MAVTPERATVELEPGAACARCARGRGCGAALFASAGAPLRIECGVVDPIREGRAVAPESPFPVGTAVEIEFPDDGSRWLLPVALAYGCPTLGLVVGACAPEPWTAFAALAGLGGGFLAWHVGGAPILAGIDAGPCRPIARIAQSRGFRIPPGENA